MALLEWNESLSVQIPSIYAQHKVLVQMINDLQAAMENGVAREVLGKVFESLKNYTVMHFAHEKKLFEQHVYPDSETHLQEHDKLVEQVLDLEHQFKSSANFLIGIDVMKFLTNWLTEHIKGRDQAYSSFLFAKGVV